MASFQVELVPSSPFFQNNLNNLDLADLWVHHPQWQTTASTSAAAGATDAQCNNNKKKKKKKNQNDNNNSDDGNSTYAAYAADKPKDKWARAREIVFPANTNTSTTPPKGGDDNNNNNNNNPNAGGVSSLVQKWRGFEAVAKRSSSGTAPPPPPLPPGPAPLSIDDDSSSSVIGDWESDRTILSGRSSIRGRDSDATESERLRVADIIRKLTPNEAGGCSVSPPRLRTSLDQCLPPPTAATTRVRTSLDHQSSDILSLRCCIAPSPRIRGRQAYLDLLSQRERDRRTDLQRLLDRKPVSKFSNRGRIQAVLKIKLLRHGIQAKEAGGHSNTINPFESYKPMQFRQRVNQKAQNGALNFEKDPAKDNNTPGPNSNSDVDHVRKQEKYQEVVVSNTKTCPRAQDDGHDCRASKHDDLLMRHNANFLHAYEEAATTTTSFIRQGTSHGLAAMSAETSSAEAPKSLDHPKEDDKATATNYDLMTHDDCALPPYGGDSILETSAYWVADFSNPEDGWEELQSDYQTKEANNIDWIDQVSRPRSDWEYLRQERYQEMLDPFLDNEEIRVLLGRKSVSNFLSSGMREKIDKLMISRSQGQVHLNNNQTQNKRGGQLGQVLKKEGEGEGEDGEYGEYFDEYEEAESSIGQQFTECDEYVDTSTPQSQNLNQNGNQNQGHVPSECSYQAASPSTQQSSTNYCSQDMTGRNSSYSTHPTFEMEIIYDLRRHMEQLHQEIAELRKSIKCCTDMQIKLHRSIKKEVSVALTHPDAKNGRRHPAKKGTSGSRRCCVCCKLQVDCLLYRCGHMCTCFDCANELHWSSGTCPICRAQILDVVRTQYSNS